MRPERLRRLDDVGVGRVLLAVDREGRGRAMHRDARLDQGVHETRRRAEVRLVRAHDEPARIAHLGRVQLCPVGIGRARTRTGTTTAARSRSRASRSHRGTTASTTAAARSTGRRHLRLNRRHAPRRHRPRVFARPLNVVAAHLVDVEEERLAIPRCQIENGVVRRQRVVDRLAEVPLLRRNRRPEARVGQQLARRERNLRRRRIANGLGQDADHVVEVRGRTQAAVPPRRVRRARARRHARLVLGQETRRHRRAHQVNPCRNQRVEVVVERIAEGRRKHHRAGGAGLVVVVHDLREPLLVHHAIHVGGFVERRHVEVAVVIVTGVLLVQHRNAARGALLRDGIPHVPVGHQFHPVRIRVHGQDDHVVENSHRLFVGAAHQLVDRFHQLLCAQHFGGVQAAVDPDHGFAFFRQRARLLVGQALSGGQPG